MVEFRLIFLGLALVGGMCCVELVAKVVKEHKRLCQKDHNPLYVCTFGWLDSKAKASFTLHFTSPVWQSQPRVNARFPFAGGASSTHYEKYVKYWMIKFCIAIGSKSIFK